MTEPLPSKTPAPANAPAPVASVDHYENFPVASWLCPPALRPAVAAIYGFARTADDIADEGEADAAQRLADLAAYREDLEACAAGRPASARWAGVFGPLAAALRSHALPVQPLADLLSAFAQDVRHTRDAQGYADRAALLDYCRRSANPVGRLMLHLYGVTDDRALAESDDVCTALQLINFWQDLSVDLPRGRLYLPAADLRAHGLDPDRPATWAGAAQARALVASECDWARGLMLRGAGIAHRVPGRAGWELRAVVQGGLRILDKIEASGWDSFRRRPTVGAADAPVILWRCLRMRPREAAPMGQSRA
ncbi:squalene synthase HpnC [Ramlibacter sp. MAHUQ-53]|uniref:squalene synthase HpnC n=1 Tax=unclassified Ramlibacter TaxID=2617605 RepID=UPI003624D2F2